MKSKFSLRKIGLAVAVLIFFLLVSLVTNSVLNAFKINAVKFDRSAKRALSTSEQISKQAAEFSETAALMELGPNPLNGFYYRFDENLMYARHSGKKLAPALNAQSNRNINFEFDNENDLPVKPAKNDFVVENGVLKYKHDGSNFLEYFGKADIDKDAIGEIEVRIKVKKTKKLIFAWSSQGDAAALDHLKTDYLALLTIPDNQFHTYRVNANSIFRGGLKTGEPIRKIFLFPFEISSDDVEIDYLRFLSREAKYSQRPYGDVYETKNKEMRKAIYTHPLHVLSYTLELPEGRSTLKFGMGILHNDDPVAFNVLLKHGGKTLMLHSGEVSDAGRWHDVGIDLSGYAKQQVEISFVAKGSPNNIAFWSNPIVFAPPQKRMNVVIVLEDALRPDHMSTYGYGVVTTPVKDEFAKRGIVFQNAFSQATHTRSSCTSMMTSLYPTATGVWDMSEMLDDRYLTLAEIMRNQGFATASFLQNVNAGPAVGLHQGFDTLFDSETLGHRADELYEDVALRNWIETNSDRNFFLFIHLLDPHGPYDPPDEVIAGYKRPFLGGNVKLKKEKFIDPAWIEVPTVKSRRFLYDKEISYNDRYFGKFLKRLEEKKLLEDTLLIFTADHGEHLGEHFIWEHMAPGYVQVLRVPLIMVYPKKLPANKRIGPPVQLLDIMPTILDLAAIRTDDLLIQGDSLVPLIQEEKPDFWTNRFCISEEVRFKPKDDPAAHGSVFFKNWHILNSDKLNDTITYKAKKFSPGLYNNLGMETRVFDLSYDTEEHFDMLNFLVDVYFNYNAQSFFKDLKKQNLVTWKTMTKDSGQSVSYNPASLEQLRSLGYVE